MKTKKLAAVVLTLALVMGISTTAFADDNKNTLRNPGSQTIGVQGSYSGTGTAADTYSVQISWGEMNFTYSTKGDKTWDPETHKYNVDAQDAWVYNDSNNVDVVNHSNVPVDVAFSFAVDTEEGYKGEYTGEMKPAQETLAAGIENKPDLAAKVTSYLELSGTLNMVEKTATKLGDITVTISSVNAEP